MDIAEVLVFQASLHKFQLGTGVFVSSLHMNAGSLQKIKVSVEHFD